jgi:hypothetical protein
MRARRAAARLVLLARHDIEACPVRVVGYDPGLLDAFSLDFSCVIPGVRALHSVRGLLSELGESLHAVETFALASGC